MNFKIIIGILTFMVIAEAIVTKKVDEKYPNFREGVRLPRIKFPGILNPIKFPGIPKPPKRKLNKIVFPRT